MTNKEAKMAFAQSQLNALLQDRVSAAIGNLSLLTLDSHDQLLSEEDRANAIREVKAGTEGLNFNNQSAATLLNAEPKRLYENYREPEANLVEATEEFEKARRLKYAEMVAWDQRRKEKKELPSDVGKTWIPAEFYLYQTEATVRVGLVRYKKTVDGVCDQLHPLLFDGEITADLYEGEIIEDPTTGSISLQGSMVNFIKKAEKIGLNREMFDKLLRLFVKNKLASNYGAVRRLEGKALFDAILALSSYTTMVNNLVRKLETITREPGAGAETALFEVKSVASEIIRLSIPNISEEKLQKKLENILFRIIPRLITDRARVEYMEYLKKLRVSLNEEATMDQRLNFINDLEVDPSYAPSEVIKIRKTDIPASLFHSKVFHGVGHRGGEESVLAHNDDYHGIGNDVMEEMYWTEQMTGRKAHMVETRASGPAPGQTLHPWGNLPAGGALNRRPFVPGPAPSTVSSLGTRGGGNETLTQALIHRHPESSGDEFKPGVGEQAEGGSRSSYGPAVGGGGGPSSEWRRGREATPRRRNFQSTSPGSGKPRFYRKGSNGSMRSVSRDRIFTYDRKGGFTPRSYTRSPSFRRFYESVDKVPKDRCVKCFRYTGAEVGDTCTATKCLRYLETPTTKTPCSICKGGFHQEKYCSLKSRSPSAGRPEGGGGGRASPGWGQGAKQKN